MNETLIKRSDKVSFMEVMDGETSTIQRMIGFTAMSNSKNPKEYTRQYVDEDFEQTDVTGYSPSIDCTLDQYKGNSVHDYIVGLIDNEKLGNDALVTIYTADKSQEGSTSGTYKTSKRTYAVIGGSEGDSMDAYTYGFTLKTKGVREVGNGTISSDGKTLTYAEITPEA